METIQYYTKCLDQGLSQEGNIKIPTINTKKEYMETIGYHEAIPKRKLYITKIIHQNLGDVQLVTK